MNLVSSGDWCESDNGVIFYQSWDSCSSDGWSQSCSDLIDYFKFEENCCSHNEMVLLFDRIDSIGKYVYFFSSDMDMASLKIINTNDDQQQTINTQNMKDDISFYFGCFSGSTYSYNGDNYECRESSNKRTLINVYTSSFLLFGDNADQNFKLFFKQSTNTKPYVFIDGLTQQNMHVNVDFTINASLFDNNIYYLFTCDNVIIEDEDTPSGYKVINTCSRSPLSRYGMVSEDLTITDCSCTLSNGQTSVSSSSNYNYPDCNYNASLFDLKLPSTSSTYSLSDDYTTWYSIIFTTSSQSIEINEGQTLTIDELDLNQESISFNGSVNVTNLTITTNGASFNILNFENIVIPTENDNTVLFSIHLTDTDLTIHSLKQCGTFVVTLSSSCECYYNGVIDEYDGFNDDVDETCVNSRTDSSNYRQLMINSTEYSVNSNEYWNVLEINEDNSTITGTAQLKANICEFENVIITINCNLYCTTLNINSNTKLIVNGKLSIDTLVITDQIINNLNENGIIESYDSTEITSIEITETQSNCFELISSNDSLSQPPINSDYSTMLLSQNHLLRICPSSVNYEVQCTSIGNTFDYSSFDLLHCPCIDFNCTINVTTSQLDTTNVEFDGTFNILTNSSIAISDQTSSFNIKYGDDKQILLIGNGTIGFNQQQLNTNIKTTILSIQTSIDNLCKALLIENEEETCIICDGNFNFDGYCTDSLGDIDNCELQNETYGCEICYEGYENNVTYCNDCPSHCLRCYNGECINCEMNYYVNESGGCSSIIEPIITYENEKAIKCNDGYYSNGNKCIRCSDNCVSCNSSTCLTCTNSINNNDNSCQTKEEGEEIINNNGVIECNDGYYLINNDCLTCSSKYDSNCELCNINKCLSCNENYVLINNSYCLTDTGCEIEDSKCLNCNDKGSWFNGTLCEKCGEGCVTCINTICYECDNDYIFNFENNTCTKRRVDNCNTYSNYYSDRCIECSDGYYLNNYKQECYSCPEHCTTCHNSTYCYECNDGYMILDDICVLVSLYLSNCKTAIPGSSGGCAICNDGYYREQTTCSECISNCTKCNNGKSCLICESNYFLLNDASECISYDELTNCETKTQSGCTKCNDGYYLNNQYCTSCDSKTNNCSLCENVGGECTTCQNDYVLVNEECIYYSLIDSCTEVSDSKCSSCSFWHAPNSDQTGCDTQVVWWVIVLIILFILIVIIIIIAIIFYVTVLYLNYRKIEKQRKLYTIFSMSRSNIQFKSTNNKDVVINKDVILFNDESEEIGVNEETRDLICVGNSSKNTIKVQFSVKDGCDKYEIRTNPQLIAIQKGKAVEFEIFIKPLCTCKINDQIMLISVALSKGKTITTPITINTQTIMTTRLDYSELIEDIKLGEGSFGIVYKGTFRGNAVAIKKMKNVNDNEKAIVEFNKEVSMLDKFRNDYIVHFYGAVFIPTKICMVIEFAQYGSCQDLIGKEEQLIKELRKKIMLDSAKGIQYLHSNGILHRDIKPDNILILSLDTNVQVNAKLTDFGSSRNVNMLMTNMTFTKGIGTPKYMAPEILDKQKYKMLSDIYSFAITMYELEIWGEAYPNSNKRFKFPWGIADFVTGGERLPKPNTMNESMYSLINNCWKQEPKERFTIDDVIGKLEGMK